MFFKKKESKINKSMKKMDKIVTSLIIGWAVGGAIFWASKTKKWKEVWLSLKSIFSSVWKKSAIIGWKTILWVLNLFSKKK